MKIKNEFWVIIPARSGSKSILHKAAKAPNVEEVAFKLSPFCLYLSLKSDFK